MWKKKKKVSKIVNVKFIQQSVFDSDGICVSLSLFSHVVVVKCEGIVILFHFHYFHMLLSLCEGIVIFVVLVLF